MRRTKYERIATVMKNLLNYNNQNRVYVNGSTMEAAGFSSNQIFGVFHGPNQWKLHKAAQELGIRITKEKPGWLIVTRIKEEEKTNEA